MARRRRYRFAQQSLPVAEIAIDALHADQYGSRLACAYRAVDTLVFVTDDFCPIPVVPITCLASAPISVLELCASELEIVTKSLIAPHPRDDVVLLALNLTI